MNCIYNILLLLLLTVKEKVENIYITLTMEQNPVPFGDDVGLEVLAALKELGEGLSKLSEIESMSKTGQREFCVM